MARKVVNITHSANAYDILSQTPKNYDPNNYFIKELQDKVNAEWAYRPNRVDIEYETDWGKGVYSPIEVVVQTVKPETGTAISDDCRQIVFHDILERRFKIGSRFRFWPDYVDRHDGEALTDKDKNVWLSTNMNSVNMTSSMVIERCNGTLGSAYQDSQGVTRYHYEPVVQGRDLTSVSFYYNETAVSSESHLVVYAQHNDYTRDYFINQRFIVGYDKVYRIQAINKFYSNSTFKPEDVGLMRIYMEMTEVSPYDDFENRIAYQIGTPAYVQTESEPGNYVIGFTQPAVIPESLGAAGVIFAPCLQTESGAVVAGVVPAFSYFLENLPSSVDPSAYVNIIQGTDQVEISRARVYLRGDLVLIWTVAASVSPTHEEITAQVKLSLRG